jgi:LmbE family N-acetylglucosaminyl deacetylase
MTFADAANQLSIVTPATLLAERGLLVIAPHPDDETLGCGGLLAWAAERGCLVHVVFLTDGERSHPDARVDLRRIRRGEALLAATRLGLLPQNISFLGLPDAGLQMLSELDVAWVGRWIRALMAERRPCLVAVTAPSDPHGDHQAAYALVANAARELAGVEVMAYPVWSWLLQDDTAPLQGLRVDIRRQAPAKRAALDAYASQRGHMPLEVNGFVLPDELLRHAHADTEVLLHGTL